MRLEELKIARSDDAYEEFEFHAIFHALNNFCSVDLSAVYLDILKDRLYTFRAGDPLRRGSQTVLYEIVVAMTKLMAPVLSFHGGRDLADARRSHDGGHSTVCILVRFPRRLPQWQDAELAQRWERLLEYRDAGPGRVGGQPPRQGDRILAGGCD